MLVSKAVSVVLLAASLLQGSMDTAMPDKDIEGTFFLVNRAETISEDYAPEVRKLGLTGLSQSMRDEAATALEELFTAAKADGINLSVVSGYRSYTKQNAIYNRKVASAGTEAANKLVALPGTSEHQLGLAVDIAKSGSSNLNSRFASTDEGQWVDANAYRYGFIVRYPEGMEDITGYSYEPWHIRYVGKAYAQEIFESGLTMDEYVSSHRAALYTYLVQQTNEVLP